jgi:hypothetical protein
MKTTLFAILAKKEVIHWRRTQQMFKKFKGWPSKITFGLIVAIFITIAHYCFALMHTLYESFLYVFARKAFKANLQQLALKV